MSQQAQNDHYADAGELAMDYAAAVNEELRDLAAAGADVVQIDEPYLQARPDPAREYALPALNRALEGIDATTALHTCFGYAAIVHNRDTGYSFLAELDGCRGGPDLRRGGPAAPGSRRARGSSRASRSSTASSTSGTRPSRRPRWSWTASAPRCEHVPPERLVLAPDCGMKYLPRAVARGKLAAMVEGARRVRDDLA